MTLSFAHAAWYFKEDRFLTHFTRKTKIAFYQATSKKFGKAAKETDSGREPRGTHSPLWR